MLQQGNVLSVYEELNHQITFQSLKQYLSQHGWKLCFYGDTTARRKHPDVSQETSIGEQIIRIADIEAYARSVPSFTYCSQENRAVFINQAKCASPSRLLRLLAHEIGHIQNNHEAIDCILGKENRCLEQEANCFMRHMMRLHWQQSIRDIFSYHKCHFLITLVFLALFGGYFTLPYISLPSVSTSSTTAPAAISGAVSDDVALSLPTETDDAAATDVPPAETPVSIIIEDTTTVYIAKTGRVVHLYTDCHYIQGHDNVSALPYEYAKEKPLCSHCKEMYLQKQGKL